MDIGKSLKDHQKLVEELLELATVITQQLNKSSKDLTAEIIEEIGDVQWRLNKIKDYYNKDLIQEQIDFKRNGQLKKIENRKEIEAKKFHQTNSYKSTLSMGNPPLYDTRFGTVPPEEKDNELY